MDFEAIKGSFWNPSVHFEVQQPLTDEVVAHAEFVLGVELPNACIAHPVDADGNDEFRLGTSSTPRTGDPPARRLD
jgi:hypothetical protein